MALTINTNMAAIAAQKNLRRIENPLMQTMNRLSSGRRINSAADDAAGLAIATRQTRGIRGLAVAQRNANDGISVAQTAEGAMDEMINAVTRIYELAEQAASYNTSADRSSLNQEVSELISELNRIVSQTRFNGEQFLNQSFSINIQVGVEVDETINVSTSNVSPDTMGAATTYASTLGGTDIGKSALLSYLSTGLAAGATIAGKDIGDALTAATAFQNNSLALINRINEYTAEHKVTAFGYGNSLVTSSAVAAVSLASGAADQYVDAGFLTINGTAIGSFVVASAATAAIASTSMDNLITAINNKSATTGVTAYVGDLSGQALSTSGNGSDIMVLTNTNGAAITASLNSSVANGTVMTNVLATAAMSVSAGQNGQIIFNSNLATTSITFDGTATGAVFGVGSSSSSVSLTANSLNDVSVTNAANANIAILAAKESLETFITEKAKLGAKLNRFQSTIRNIESTRENLIAARSRTLDTDFATETTKFTKLLILQQSGISILSQANSQPQQILALLQ